MKPVFSIRSKSLIWYFAIVRVFSGTIFFLHQNVRNLVTLSETIISKNYEVASLAKKMIGNLLDMEENEKKYRLLNKNEYWGYFSSNQADFLKNIERIFRLESKKVKLSPVWQEIHQEFIQYSNMLGPLRADGASEVLWLPESVINKWIKKISLASTHNEAEIESATREINLQAQAATRNGLAGMVIAFVVGLFGIIFLSYSFIRPLRTLLAGIRSISKEGSNLPIVIRTKDEFSELAHAFNEMTAQLKEEERMRSDFISTLSHEIRTPLTSIRESVNLLREGVVGAVNAQQGKFLKIASSEISRICDLLDRLMQASRLQSDAVEMHRHKIDTREFVSLCLSKVKSTALAKNIRLYKQVPDHIPAIIGDPEHLQRVFLNILDNAIKFSGEGGEVKVSATAERSGKMVVFSISDNGPGVPKEEHLSIFKKYYRGREVRDYMDGVGIGLSVSKDIVEAHKGNIWVNSTKSGGSTFHFTLPSDSEGSNSKGL